MAEVHSRHRNERAGPTDWCVNAAARGLIGLALLLPYRLRVSLGGRAMRWLVAPLAGYRRQALANLAATLPELAETDRRRIADAVCDNAGRTLIENYSTAELLARMAGVEPAGPGMTALVAARAAGRPVILATGHFGNYEAGRAALVARGYAVGGLFRPMRNRYFNAHYVRTMQAFGGPVFGQGPQGTAGFVRHLRSGGQLVLLFDQHVNRGEPFDFLGRPALTAMSAAELALRYDALLIPFYATRAADGFGFAIDLEAPVPHSDARIMTEALTKSLEARIRAHPGQWFWIHRRWKPKFPAKVRPAPPAT
ncbi:MAG: lysophospholipid acyltransferase family protein [Paracoccaceae bacterium]